MEVLQETKIGNGRIIKGDCLSIMNELPDDHYILGFTSPPYLNAINYDAHVEKLHGTKERWEREDISYRDKRSIVLKVIRHPFCRKIAETFAEIDLDSCSCWC